MPTAATTSVMTTRMERPCGRGGGSSTALGASDADRMCKLWKIGHSGCLPGAGPCGSAGDAAVASASQCAAIASCICMGRWACRPCPGLGAGVDTAPWDGGQPTHPSSPIKAWTWVMKSWRARLAVTSQSTPAGQPFRRRRRVAFTYRPCSMRMRCEPIPPPFGEIVPVAALFPLRRDGRQPAALSHPSPSRVHLDPVVALQPIEEERDQPAQPEQRDDCIAKHAQIIVERGDGRPEGAADAEPVADEAERLDSADNHGDQHRGQGNGHVVIELADRLDEGPAIGAEHEDAVGGVDEAHAGGEEGREDEDRPNLEALGCSGGGNAQEADLGRRVEAEAEEKAERIHVPAPADQPEERAEETPEEAATGEQKVEVVLDQAPAPSHPSEAAIDTGEDDEIGERDGKEEEHGNRGADEAAKILEGGEASLHGARSEGDGGGGERHHGRMAEREIESGGDWSLSLLHKLAGDVVDGGDVIGIDGVAQPEAIGEERCAEEDGMGAKGEKRPGPGAQVGEDEDGIEAGDLAAERRRAVAWAATDGMSHESLPRV